MEVKLLLATKKLVRLPETLVAGQNIVIALESSIYDLGMLGVAITNGTRTETRVLEGENRIDISSFCDRACKIDIKVELIIKGRVAKEWRLEPIVVREIDGEFEPIPQIADFERRISRMEGVIVEFSDTLKNLL